MEKHDDCGRCWQAVKAVGEALSCACRWLWGLLEAVRGLDDPREARELDEAHNANHRAYAEIEVATRGAPAAVRARCMAACAAADRENHDVLAYDEQENELHAQIRHDGECARAALAPLSRAADRAEAEAYHTSGGGRERVWERMGAQMIEAREPEAVRA